MDTKIREKDIRTKRIQFGVICDAEKEIKNGFKMQK